MTDCTFYVNMFRKKLSKLKTPFILYSSYALFLPEGILSTCLKELNPIPEHLSYTLMLGYCDAVNYYPHCPVFPIQFRLIWNICWGTKLESKYISGAGAGDKVFRAAHTYL